MAKTIMQFRYYNEIDKTKNYPKNLAKSQLTQGNIFKDYLPFTYMKIYAPTGTKFFLNGNNNSPILIGTSGIYELDLEGIAEITSLKFDNTSIENINNNESSYLTIDVICNK